MIGEYSCPYLSNSGKACGRACIRPEGCRFHWKAKKRIPCSDCDKPTASACGRCPDHVRGYYVTQYYNRLRANATHRDTLANLNRLRAMATHRDTLANLNISLCRECLFPIKIEEGIEYCNDCQPT